MKNTTRFFIALAIAFLYSGIASADLISWSNSVDLYQGSTVETFVNTNGTSVLAINATDDDGSSANVNGVNFQAVNAAGLNSGVTQNGVTVSASAVNGQNDGAFGDGEFSGNGEIFQLLKSGHFNGLGDSISFSGLTAGATYEIQVFTNDARSSRNSNFIVGFSDGVDNFTDSLANGTAGFSSLNNSGAGGTSAGDSITGSFVANASGMQSFDLAGTNNNGSTWNNQSASQINGLQLRLIPVPEPGSTSLLIAMLCFAGSRRRR